MATINETETIDPDLKSMERQELSHLAYFRQKIADLRNRGVIAGDLFETIDSEICLSREAIYRHGLYRAQLGRARKLVKSKELVKARQWAARARMTKPEMREAWELEIRVCESLEQLEDAIGLCNEAVERFPDMAAILEQLRHQRLEQLRREQVRQEAEQKRRAELGQQREMRASKQPARKEPEPEFAGDGTLTPAVLSASPERRELAISWSSVAGEFLLEHWQKLILCMAVLLIVVSSTVGAHLLLGEKLWSPVGKCSLAMVATLLFAALGKVLVRWGAERPGQMMLITTLIVVPIHFMLAGELRLVLEPSSLRLVGFAIQVAALLVLSRCGRHARAGQGCLVPDCALDLDERLQRHDGPSGCGALGVAVCRLSGSRAGVSGCGTGAEAPQLGAFCPGQPLVRQPLAGTSGLRPGDQSDPDRGLRAGSSAGAVRGAGDVHRPGLRSWCTLAFGVRARCPATRSHAVRRPCPGGPRLRDGPGAAAGPVGAVQRQHAGNGLARSALVWRLTARNACPHTFT